MSKRRVAVIGAGPGGLTAAMLLSHRGYEVDVYEKASQVGGRNAQLTLGDYKFDIGPTFLMYIDVLEQIFKNTNRSLKDYIKLHKIDPMYRLLFQDKPFFPTNNIEAMLNEISRVFPGNEDGYLRYLEKEEKRFGRLEGCLTVRYDKSYHLLRLRVLKAIPSLDLGRSMYDRLKSYFKDEEMVYAMAFQAKYLGMFGVFRHVVIFRTWLWNLSRRGWTESNISSYGKGY